MVFFSSLLERIKMKNKIFLLAFMLFICGSVKAQSSTFNIYLEPLTVPGLGGLQAYAYGQDNGKWLIIGGRLDGLHRRQPFAAFDLAGHNNQLLVIDPNSQQKWASPLTSLPVALQEQLSSTNMEFHQHGNMLYIIGGYGYSATAGDHTTYPNLTAVKVSEVIDAIIQGTPFNGHFRQITDTMFAVTGGYLNKINDTYYLTGGQKFIGRYNPMGPTHGPGFFQEYTNAIRKFNIQDDGTNLSITHLPGFTDAANLHRRDYNVVHQIMPDGSEGLTAFSGVFQTNADLPFLNCVNIDSQNYQVNNSFSQYYNHYHCAHIPLYSATNNEMHTLFFGGIAQYYDSLGVLVQDNNVPFVKTIARVTRNSAGTMAEFKLPEEMPALLGAGSEFIGIETIPHYPNKVLKLDDLTSDTTHLGYIYGGISSTAPNIFFTNTGTQSTASSQIFKVFLIKNLTSDNDVLNQQSIGTLKMQVVPNPNNGIFSVKYFLKKPTDVKISIYDVNGKQIEEKTLTDLSSGENTYHRKIRNMESGGVYILTIETPYEQATQRIILEP